MRKKVTDYLTKPSKKLFEELTTMEQKYVENYKSGDETPAPAKPKKP